MEGFKRKADGRRIFSVEFRRQVVGQIHSGEKTLAELSRELEIQPSVLRNWIGLVDRGGTTAVAAGEDVVPASPPRRSERHYFPFASSHASAPGVLRQASPCAAT